MSNDGCRLPCIAITAFELTEARLLFEGEAAALAAITIEPGELDRLDQLVAEIAVENLRRDVTENADQDFPLTIAAATRNAEQARLSVASTRERFR